MNDVTESKATARRAVDTTRLVLARVEIHKAPYGSYPWYALDPESGTPVALPPERDEIVEAHGKRHSAISLVWPQCFARKRDVMAALDRYRKLLEDIDAAR